MTTVVGPELEEIKDRVVKRIVARVEAKLMTKKYRRLGRLFNRPLPVVVTAALDQFDDDVEAAQTVAEVRAIAKAFVDQYNL